VLGQNRPCIPFVGGGIFVSGTAAWRPVWATGGGTGIEPAVQYTLETNASQENSRKILFTSEYGRGSRKAHRVGTPLLNSLI